MSNANVVLRRTGADPSFHRPSWIVDREEAGGVGDAKSANPGRLATGAYTQTVRAGISPPSDQGQMDRAWAWARAIRQRMYSTQHQERERSVHLMFYVTSTRRARESAKKLIPTTRAVDKAAMVTFPFQPPIPRLCSALCFSDPMAVPRYIHTYIQGPQGRPRQHCQALRPNRGV